MVPFPPMKTRLVLVSVLSLMVVLLAPGAAFGSQFQSIVCAGEQETSTASINTNGTVVGSCYVSATAPDVMQCPITGIM